MEIGKIFPFFCEHMGSTDWAVNVYTTPNALNWADYADVFRKNIVFCEFWE